MHPIEVDINPTVGTLTVAHSLGSRAPRTITFAVDAGVGSLRVRHPVSVVIEDSVDVHLASDVDIDVVGIASLEVVNGIHGPGGIEKRGSGILRLHGSDYQGATTITEGTVKLECGAALPFTRPQTSECGQRGDGVPRRPTASKD
jgi:autotransporter-associated beta strand protein